MQKCTKSDFAPLFGAGGDGVAMAKDGDEGWGKGLGYGLEIATGAGLGALVGYWWDSHHHSSPWGLLVGLLIGTAAGMYLLIKDISRMNKP